MREIIKLTPHNHYKTVFLKPLFVFFFFSTITNKRIVFLLLLLFGRRKFVLKIIRTARGNWLPTDRPTICWKRRWTAVDWKKTKTNSRTDFSTIYSYTYSRSHSTCKRVFMVSSATWFFFYFIRAEQKTSLLRPISLPIDLEETIIFFIFLLRIKKLTPYEIHFPPRRRCRPKIRSNGIHEFIYSLTRQ